MMEEEKAFQNFINGKGIKEEINVLLDPTYTDTPIQAKDLGSFRH